MSEAEQNKSDLEALQELDTDSQDLERLEALLDQFNNQFNIFEAMKFPIRGEERHSNFLAFLMNPRQNHGMGDAFVKRFLEKALEQSPRASSPVTVIELGQWDLDQMQVWREEWWRIDILLLDERNRLAVIIENKIDAGEHGDQLERYYETVREKYPDHKTLAIFLTPTETMPSYKKYLPLDYGAVCEALDELGNNQSVPMNPGVRTLITHYAMMLRRYIVEESQIAKLSRQIYRKHKRTIDLIIEHRPTIQSEARNLIVDLIQNERLDRRGKVGTTIYFRPQEWDGVAALNAGRDTAGFFRFVFYNRGNELFLILQACPGDKQVRRRLFEMGRKNESLFNHLEDPATHNYPMFYRRTFLTPDLYQKATSEEREAKIRENWNASSKKICHR